MRPYIAVDLDGTLAEYHGWQGIEHIGKPIKPMVQRVKRWLREGREVRCFTARVYNDPIAAKIVRGWLNEHGLQQVDTTCVKDRGMVALLDDRATRVELNTGKVLGRVKFYKPCVKANA